MTVQRRRAVLLLAASAAGFVPTAWSQVPAAGVAAVPFYTPSHFAQGLYRHFYAPRAQDFGSAAKRLVGALETHCATPGDLQTARAGWADAVQAWERLAAVSVGPLVQRRSARQIDFAPMRPELLARALRSPPQTLQALERVGAPARGLPALEHLLWVQPATPGSPTCAYAALLAREIEQEAQALAQAFAQLAAKDWSGDEGAAQAAMAEMLNQWVGGLERLRWAQMEKPLRSGGAGLPRTASGLTRRSWASQWDSVRSLGLGQAAPAPGEGLVALDTYLRGRGLNPLADRLARSAEQAGERMVQADPGRAPRTLAASKALASLKRLAEAEVAPALQVQMGFSDRDGD